MDTSTRTVLCICFFTLFITFCESQIFFGNSPTDNTTPMPSTEQIPSPTSSGENNSLIFPSQTSDTPTSGDISPAPQQTLQPYPGMGGPHPDKPNSPVSGIIPQSSTNPPDNLIPQSATNTTANPPVSGITDKPYSPVSGIMPQSVINPPASGITDKPNSPVSGITPQPVSHSTDKPYSPVSGIMPQPSSQITTGPVSGDKPRPAPQNNINTGPVSGDKPRPAPQNNITTGPVSGDKPRPAPQNNINTGPVSGDKPRPAPQNNINTGPVSGDKPRPAPQNNINTGPVSGVKPPSQITTGPVSGDKPRPAPHSNSNTAPRPAPQSIKSCDGACASSAPPCPNAFCGRDLTSLYLSCKWITSLCVPVVVSNVTANCSVPGACGIYSPSCNYGTKPVCQQTGLTCTYVCLPSGSGGGVQIDCSNQCLGTPYCSDAQCKLVSLSVSTSSAVQAQCQWVCPDPCATWCSTYSCPSGTNQIACGLNPSDSSSCLPVCATSECSSSANCQATQCAAGTVGICRGPKNNCTLTCSSLTCVDPCSPNCAPICTVSSPPPCVNSRCAMIQNTTLSNSASILSKCVWTPSFSSTQCISQQIKIPVGKPLCASSTCQTDANGTAYWDNSACYKDCSSVSQSACPGGYVNCTAGPGICILSGGNCIWTCPVDPCVSSSGNSLCPSPAPEGPPFPGCINWKRRCLVTNTTGSQPVCSWDVRCTQVSQTATGPCNASFDCGNKPNTTACPGKENWSCFRPAVVGPCQWVFTCPPDPTLSTPCSNSDCPVLATVDSSSSSICGVNPDAVPVCIRNSKGTCERQNTCLFEYSPPACVVSPCGDVCYDPRWLTGEITPPDSFTSNGNFSTNCSRCEKLCATLLSSVCTRPISEPICQFSTSTSNYDNCIAKTCTNTPIPSNTSNVVSPCRGQDPCSCDYTQCTFVTTTYPSGVLCASCLSNDLASNAISLPGVKSVYSINSVPSYCLAPVSTSTPTSYSTNIINKVANLNSDDIQQNILSQLVNTNTSELVNYTPQISAVLVASVSTSGGVNIGVIMTLSGNNNPTTGILNTWCIFVLGNVADSILVSKIGVCVVTLQSSGQKRNLMETPFSGTYSLTMDVNTTTPNSPGPGSVTPGTITPNTTTPGTTSPGPGTTTPGTTSPGPGTITPGTTTPGTTSPGPGTTTPGTTTPGTTTPGTTTPGTTTPGTTTPGTTTPGTPATPKSPGTNGSDSKLMWSFFLFTLVVLVVF